MNTIFISALIGFAGIILGNIIQVLIHHVRSKNQIVENMKVVLQRMEGIESMSKGVIELKSRIGAQEELCKRQHRWDGTTERRKI